MMVQEFAEIRSSSEVTWHQEQPLLIANSAKTGRLPSRVSDLYGLCRMACFVRIEELYTLIKEW